MFSLNDLKTEGSNFYNLNKEGYTHKDHYILTKTSTSLFHVS